MKLLNIFKSGPSDQFDALLKDLINEANHRKPYSYTDPPYHQLENVKKIQMLPEEQLAAFIAFLVQTAKSDWVKKKSFSWSGVWYHSLRAADQLLKHFLIYF